jgi:DNA-binding HxlR family transcriptional regulator
MTESTPRPCSVAAALGVIGEKWSLLVIRELAFNVHRFDSIAKNTGAPRDILTSRLRRLETAGVLEKRQYQERPVRFEYHLTEAGNELRPVLLSLAQWGDRWASDVPPTVFVHSCGEDVELVHTCRACGGEITGLDLRARSRRAEWSTVASAVAGD